jgi:hypothetical protein
LEVSSIIAADTELEGGRKKNREGWKKKIREVMARNEPYDNNNNNYYNYYYYSDRWLDGSKYRSELSVPFGFQCVSRQNEWQRCPTHNNRLNCELFCTL